MEYHSLFPLFCYLNSLANGNFLGRTRSEAIVVVTKRNGENPTIRMSAFFLYFSFFFFFFLLLPAAFQVQSAGGKEERVVVVVVVLGWGSASPASLLPLSQTGPVWSFAV